MSKVVLDASVAGTWMLSTEIESALQELCEHCAAHGVVVPPLFKFEISNMLARWSRSRDAHVAKEAETVLDSWPILVDLDGPTIAQLTQLALASGLSAYDSAYLELAHRYGLPLATLDRKLAVAARAVGIEVVP